MSNPPKSRDAQALAAKPRKLAALDRRVRAAPPRESRRAPGAPALLVHGRAALAWITRTEEGWDGGYESGPSYLVQYCFETVKGELRHDACGGAFDALHLAYGGGSEWSDFLADCCSGDGARSFTVLYNNRESAPVAALFSFG